MVSIYNSISSEKLYRIFLKCQTSIQDDSYLFPPLPTATPTVPDRSGLEERSQQNQTGSAPLGRRFHHHLILRKRLCF